MICYIFYIIDYIFYIIDYTSYPIYYIWYAVYDIFKKKNVLFYVLYSIPTHIYIYTFPKQLPVTENPHRLQPGTEAAMDCSTCSTISVDGLEGTGDVTRMMLSSSCTGKMARIAGYKVGLINLFEEMVLWCFM